MAYRHRATQLSFQSFNNGLGVPLSSDNEWVQLADMLPWQQLDEAYQLLFTEMGGRAAKPFRLLYGASLIKQAEHLTDRSVVTAIRDTPAYQYFIGLDTYTTDLPFNHSTLVYFRRRMGQITELVRNIISDTLREQIQSLLPDDELRVLITDATAVPIEIRFPQDTSLLNQARLNLEEMLLDMAHQLQIKPPRTYKREAKAKWTAFARKPRRWAKETRKQIKVQLQYVRRDLRYIDVLLAHGASLNERQTKRLAVIRELFDQQMFMYENRTHRVPGRIVSLAQPWIRPINRGKAKQRTEFGPKIDASIADGMIDIERFDFKAFNESQDLATTIDHYFDVHGYYPDEILADTLYRTRENRQLCQRLGIRLSGPRLGRKPKKVDAKQRQVDRDAEKRRGKIERGFAFMKGPLGLSLVRTKTVASIAVTIDIAINLANLKMLLRLFNGSILIFVKYKQESILIHYQIHVSGSRNVA